MTEFKKELEEIIHNPDKYLPDYIENIPMIAVLEEGSEEIEEVEELDFENYDVTTHDNYAEVYAGGDWQSPATFNLVLNPNKKGKKYLAVNVRYHSDMRNRIYYDFVKNEQYSYED